MEELPEADRVVRVKLSEEDIAKLADAIVEKSTSVFQVELGKAVLNALWKGLLGAGALGYLWFSKK